MKKYETMYIIKSTLDEEGKNKLVEELHSIITSFGGNIENVDDKGLKDFAYEIDDMTKGYYVVVTYNVNVEGLNEFKRLMGINSSVIREMTLDLTQI